MKPAGIAASSPVLVGTMTPSGADAGKHGEASNETNCDISPQPAGGTGHPPLPSASVWAKWVLGPVLRFAVPLCKRILRTEDVVEKRVEAAAKLAEEGAEVVKQVAADVARDLPVLGGGSLRKVTIEVEEVADMVIVYTQQVEAFIHKVDELKEEVEEAMKPIIKEVEAN